jgi:hypothetical protein
MLKKIQEHEARKKERTEIVEKLKAEIENLKKVSSLQISDLVALREENKKFKEENEKLNATVLSWQASKDAEVPNAAETENAVAEGSAQVVEADKTQENSDVQ